MKKKKNIASWAKKSSVKGQSIPQELEESLRRGLRLLVYQIILLESYREYHQSQYHVNHHEFALLQLY